MICVRLAKYPHQIIDNVETVLNLFELDFANIPNKMKRKRIIKQEYETKDKHTHTLIDILPFRFALMMFDNPLECCRFRSKYICVSLIHINSFFPAFSSPLLFDSFDETNLELYLIHTFRPENRPLCFVYTTIIIILVLLFLFFLFYTRVLFAFFSVKFETKMHFYSIFFGLLFTM